MMARQESSRTRTGRRANISGLQAGSRRYQPRPQDQPRKSMGAGMMYAASYPPFAAPYQPYTGYQPYGQPDPSPQDSSFMPSHFRQTCPTTEQSNFQAGWGSKNPFNHRGGGRGNVQGRSGYYQQRRRDPPRNMAMTDLTSNAGPATYFEPQPMTLHPSEEAYYDFETFEPYDEVPVTGQSDGYYMKDEEEYGHF